MKKLLKLLTVLIICLSIIGVKKIDAKEAFDINYHNVDIVVNEDGSFLITETMSVRFNKNRHGIYVNLTDEYYMDWKVDSEHGEVVQKYYRFPISNVKVLSSHKYEVKYYNGDVQIKIGHPDHYAKQSEVYVWQYVIHTTDLDLEGLDMLFMNIITTGWNTDTYGCEFTIHFPKSFDNANIYVSSPEGMLNGLGTQGLLTVERKDNTIIGKYDGKIAFDEGITIQVLLGQDYYKFPDSNKYGLIGAIIAAIVGVIYLVLYFVYGKDDPIIPLVEYHAPKDITSAEVGVIIDEDVNASDMISLILDWGRRGIITITETDDDLVLTKINDLEEDAKNYERIFFDGLFKNKQSVVVSTLKEKFYITMEKAIASLKKYYQKEKLKLSTKSSKIVQIICTILSFVPFAAAFLTVELGYNYRYAFIFAVTLGSVEIIFGTVLLNYLYQKRYVLKWWQYLLAGLLLVFILGGPMIALYATFASAKINVIYFITIGIFQGLVIFLTMIMRKKTIYGNEMLSRILGLREFIINASQQELEDLIEKNPYYFYDILPFAYALGLTNIWNEHFKNLTFEKCDWYDSPYYYDDHYSNYHMMHSMNSHLNTMRSTMTSTPLPDSSSDGGGSSSGGDFSSGGGFGGSSGGSW